jgi:hypothetical protein
VVKAVGEAGIPEDGAEAAVVKAVGEAGIPEDGAEAAVTDNTDDCVFYCFFFSTAPGRFEYNI